MTALELKDKLTASQEKVDKRLNTISKLCKKLNVNKEDLLKAYREKATGSSYLRMNDAKNIVAQFVNYKEEPNKWDEEIYNFNNNVTQLVENLAKLKEVENIRDNWQAKYTNQLNKEQAPKIKVLMDFLDKWEEKARNWYHTNANYMVDSMNKFHDIAYKWLDDNGYFELNSYSAQKELRSAFNKYFEDTYHISPRYKFSWVDENDWLRNKDIDNLTKELSSIRFEADNNDPFKNYDSNVGHLSEKGKYFLKNFNEEKLNKILREEKQRKYEDLVNRITSYVGEIQDVSNLSIGNKTGELNGIVKGSNGSARIETIGAGGYNVQVFHYRILIHKIK